MRIATWLIALVACAPGVATERYEIDPAHAFVSFSIAHFAGRAHGTFDDVRGTILFDEKDVTKSSVSVVIKTSSIHTGNVNRDAHLRSDDFFASEKYPEATFKSSRVDKREGKLMAVGELTIRGVTKEVSMEFTVNGPMKDPLPTGVKRLLVQASLKFDRRVFGISWSRVTESNELFVGNEVSLDINVEAIVPKVVNNHPAGQTGGEVYGETAILTGRFNQVVRLKAQSFTGQFRYTDVYVRRVASGRLCAHSSRISEKK